MAEISINPAFPDILIVTGSEIYAENYVDELKAFIYGLSSSDPSPVKKGTHDFWVTYSIPGTPGAFHTGEDSSVNPRRLRGIIQMGRIPEIAEIPGNLSTLQQEVAHHWLVPHEMEFNIAGARLNMPPDFELVSNINNEEEFSGLNILGRDNAHWSSYFKADGSPLDGLCYLEYPPEDGYGKWGSSDHCGMNIAPAGLPSILCKSAYCDLDLLLMGVKTPQEAYGGANNGISWMNPQLTSPLEYHTGLFLAFSRNDQLMFGFDEGHEYLAVRSSDGNSILTPFKINPDYHPLGHPFNGMALRVIRKGTTYYFQAKINNPISGCISSILESLGLSAGEKDRIWYGADNPSDTIESISPSFSDWTNVSIVSHPGEPNAIGMFINKRKHPHFCDTAFHNLYIKTGTNKRVLLTTSVPPAIAAGNYAALSTNQLNRENPEGAIFRSKEGRIHIIAPFSTVNDGNKIQHYPDTQFKHDTHIDNSPKVLTKAPTGDFSFATNVKVHRTIVTPWAGGYGANRTVWGKIKSTAASSAIIPSSIRSIQPPPPGNAYKFGFMVIARNQQDVTPALLQRLDTVRRYWDEAFKVSTINRRTSNSEL
ncbi:MAG: hypothetical protein IPG86_16235 [Chitinophagaceae bacterium]|nr:hypothetical protein [Chitinophagaceae bacterium]